MVYGSFSDFTIAVNNVEFKLKGANWDAFHGSSKPKFELKFYDDDIAYIYKRMFMPPKDFLHFMDSAFTAIAEKQINYLIIDNLQGGGLTDLADSLISYFAERPYSLLEKKMTKISFLTKEFIEDKKNEGYVQDDYFVQEYQKHNAIRTDRFTGSTFILTGPLSYSAATAFPAAIKSSQNAFIVGEETGQPLISNGDQNQFMLPTTKMFCITAISRVYMSGHNNDEINGVFPDFNVVPTLDDILNDNAYSLEYTLNLIRENKFNNQKSIFNTKDAYFGQKPPGKTSELFAPGIINHLAHSSPSFTPDGKKIYWSTVSGKNETRKIFYVKYENNMWSEPILAPFSGKYHDDQPFISYTGNKLYFASKRPKIVNGEQANDIWISNKTDQGWDEPKTINNLIGLWTPTVCRDGTMYFLDLIDGKRVICCSELKNGKYLEVEILNKNINKEGSLNWCPFIAHDESYLIFSSDREGNLGSGDLYISFKSVKGEWQTAINMGNTINTDKQERFPGVSPDGKYLFFTRWHSSPYYHDLYWVDAGIINDLKRGAQK